MPLCPEYIVIGHRNGGLKPEIILETNNEQHARSRAFLHLSCTKCDVYVFDTSTYECILALTDEKADTP